MPFRACRIARFAMFLPQDCHVPYWAAPYENQAIFKVYAVTHSLSLPAWQLYYRDRISGCKVFWLRENQPTNQPTHPAQTQICGEKQSTALNKNGNQANRLAQQATTITTTRPPLVTSAGLRGAGPMRSLVVKGVHSTILNGGNPASPFFLIFSADRFCLLCLDIIPGPDYNLLLLQTPSFPSPSSSPLASRPTPHQPGPP
ncbi:hypothetical protein IF1G_01285 [Cordyceps javanica]|uniref:Uncharacterized protein n=1 Tax=Cordyceps javanica TaxID=43265 RepID=A0A545VBG5_9HYPO|nr:hypothetical protein IF1G_01285 [Cordyceps javanica]